MSAWDPIELHAYLDGELPAARRAQIAARLAQDPALAAQLADFARDKAALRAAFAPAAQRPLPPEWITRIETAQLPGTRPARPRFRLAAAAALVLAVGATLFATLPGRHASILEQAARARGGEIAPVRSFAADTLPQEASREALLRGALGVRVHVPDLARFGYRLAELRLYRDRRGTPAAGLRYLAAGRPDIAIYLQPSDGQARFDLLRQGRLRICLWQDDVIGAVITGEMSAGEMMRVASLAYASLNL